MAKKKNNPITKVEPEANALMPAAPDFMDGEKDTGTEDLSQYMMVQRLQIIQSGSDDTLKAAYGEGSVVISPADLLVDEHESDEENAATFNFIPIFFFTEFLQWNQRGHKPAILDRSSDPKSKLAALCRNEKIYTQEVDGRTISNCEHLNWICVLPDGGFNQPVVMSFNKSEFKTGKMFASLIKMRESGKPLYGMRFQATVEKHSNEKGKWKGFRISNPEDGQPWITDPEVYAGLKALYAEMKENHANSSLRTDFTGEEGADTVGVEDDGEM